MLSFVGKHLNFYPKDIYSVSVAFLLLLLLLLFKWRGVKLTSMSNKIWRKIPNSRTLTNSQNKIKKTANKHRELNFCHNFHPFIQVWECMVKYFTVA